MFHYPEGKSSRAPAIDPATEYQEFLRLAAAEGYAMASESSSPTSAPAALNEELLACAGRMAWRNSTRCVGRFFWQSLQVRDCRNLCDADDVFEACLEHLRFATNGGKIRPLLTVFPAASPGQTEPRMLNHQLIRYAGYDLGNGRVKGDPQNLAFTQYAIRCGWKPPANPGAFDLLPVAIRMPGQPVRWYEMPRSEVLEIPLRHPQFPWFADLGLKWHAVPVITDMCFAAAGTRFTCAPFSGWYMGTEIGARNLSDENRYNMLPVIAERMGLHASSRHPLWKDRALVELNEAVIHSFAQDGVTLVDHHNATAQFMRFQKREAQHGRAVKGDWSWLVPPLSGSTTPVFHRSYDPRPLLPNFFYQDSPWMDESASKMSGT
jgi:nitric-oxide synthase